jgi:polyisoprenoid-binding protein YceI
MLIASNLAGASPASRATTWASRCGAFALANWARGKDFFDVKKHPRAIFKVSLQSPLNGVPTQLVRELTMHGVTRH